METRVAAPSRRRLASAGERAEAAELVFDRATKVYGVGAPAVDELSLTVPAGELCALVGPSGGGKTTALKLVNRLVELTSGDVRLDERSIKTLDATELRRGIGYVIQQVGLFPHLTIEENIGTVPRLYGRSKDWRRVRSHELLELVGLDLSYAKRYPSQLSGGERQRIGLARAVAANPWLMLMDEPFGAIDPIVRAHLQDEFLRLQREVRKTVLFVTHDIDEAIKVGDRIAILGPGGRLAQYDTPENILKRPANAFVADFVGRDRALKALALRTLGELELRTATDGIPAPRTMTLRDALSLLIAERADVLSVTDDDGRVLGSLTKDDLA
ncbi:MAG: ABC transporter ATP-binding protein [Gaiellaceae bacterium]